jgi:O-antigen biosynthesis protein
MKILITCFRLNYSGSATYTFTLCRELIKRKHEPFIFSCLNEEMASEFERNGIRILDAEALSGKNFDVIIAQHSVMAEIARYHLPQIPMIFISHGVLPELEKAPSFDINIQKFICVSEECKESIISQGIAPENVCILRNMIDTDRFAILRPINEKLQNALVISNHNSHEAFKKIRSACKELGIKISFIGRWKSVFETEKEINKADIVFSLGRGALEAMSCGRAVIIYDYGGGDGIITEKNYSEIGKNNFSGRRYSIEYTTEELTDEIKKYSSLMSSINRNIILKNYNAKKISEDLENILQNAINIFQPKRLNIPGPEINFLCKSLKLQTEENNRLKNRKLIRLSNLFRK